MRNLKRALSLVMAAAMLIGMMAVSASAADNYEDFTDKDEIQNTEAVNTMVSLGVINGKEDGSYFDPTGIVTRAEMAKLIAVSLNGGKDPVLGSGASTTQFSDTKGNWAEAYIAYCANLGIINGKGDGTFGPNEPVTGTAAAKMFLTALGYRSDIEGLTGAGWDLNTDTLANKVNLYNGLDITPSNGLTRDDTAQLIYNGVQAQEVEYRNNYGEYSGVIYAQDNGTMLENRFGVVKVTGIVEANDVMATSGSPARDGYTRFDSNVGISVSGGDYTTSQVNSIGVTFPVTVSNDLVGQEIVIYVKFNNTLSPNASSCTVLGNGIVTDNNTVVETTTRLRNADTVRSNLRGDGISVDGDQKEVLFTVDGRSITDSDEDGTDGIVTTYGLKQRFIDNNNDGAVDLIIQELPALARVSAYNTSGETLTLTGGIGSLDFDDVVGYEDVARNDYVLIISYDGDTYYISGAESVEGEVTAYNSANTTISIDGTSYRMGDTANANKSGLSTDTAFGDMVGDTYTLYLDNYGNILAYELGSAAVENLALVLASGSSEGTLGSFSGQVRLLLADGTRATYDVAMEDSAEELGADTDAVDTDSEKTEWTAKALADGVPAATYTGGGAEGTGGLVGEIVAYTVDDDNNVIIGLPGAMNSRNYENIYLDSAQTFRSTTTSYGGAVADDNTVFFIGNSDDGYSVITGVSNLSSTARTSDAFTEAADGTKMDGAYGTVVGYRSSSTSSTQVAQAVFLPYGDAYQSSANYVYVIDDYTQISSTVYEYPVVFEDGTMGVLQSRSSSVDAGQVYAYTLNSSGYASFTQPTAITNGYVVTYASGNTAVFADGLNEDAPTLSGVLSSSADIWNVEDADVEDASSVFEEDSLAENMSVAYITNSDERIATVFVIDSNTVFEDVTNGTNQYLTVNGVNLAAGESVSVANGYTVSVDGATALVYDYSVGSRDYPDNSVSRGYFTMPDNSSGVTITSATGASGTRYYTLTVDGEEYSVAEGADITSYTEELAGNYYTTDSTNFTLNTSVPTEMPGNNLSITSGYYRVEIDSTAVSDVSATITTGEYLLADGGDVVVEITGSGVAGTETSVTASIAADDNGKATLESSTLGDDVSAESATATFTVSGISDDFTIEVTALT